MYHNIYKGGYISKSMTNAEERQKRIVLLSESVPREPVSRKKFVANFSIDYAMSTRTVNQYLQTLIDAERVTETNKEIFRA